MWAKYVSTQLRVLERWLLAQSHAHNSYEMSQLCRSLALEYRCEVTTARFYHKVLLCNFGVNEP
eukprot:6198620-Amphidinium_carterae.1